MWLKCFKSQTCGKWWLIAGFTNYVLTQIQTNGVMVPYLKQHFVKWTYNLATAYLLIPLWLKYTQMQMQIFHAVLYKGINPIWSISGINRCLWSNCKSMSRTAQYWMQIGLSNQVPWFIGSMLSHTLESQFRLINIFTEHTSQIAINITVL